MYNTSAAIVIYIYAYIYLYSATMYNSHYIKCTSTSLFFIPFVCNYKVCTAGTESRSWLLCININNIFKAQQQSFIIFIHEAIPKCFNNMKHVLRVF